MPRTTIIGNQEGSEMKQDHEFSHRFCIACQIDTVPVVTAGYNPIRKFSIRFHTDNTDGIPMLYKFMGNQTKVFERPSTYRQ